MSYACDRAGTFRGRMTAPALLKGKDPSKSVGIAFIAQLREMWDFDANQWVPWSEYQQEAEGAVWIVKKDGSVNQLAVDSLVNCVDWSGNLCDIPDGTFVGGDCQFLIKEETYRDETMFKVAFINPYDSIPGGGGNMSADEARLVQSQIGSQLRAIASSVKRGAKKPDAGSKPPAPPKTRPPVNAPVSVEAGGDGEIPF
jgi:hypothetical protein